MKYKTKKLIAIAVVTMMVLGTFASLVSAFAWIQYK